MCVASAWYGDDHDLDWEMVEVVHDRSYAMRRAES